MPSHLFYKSVRKPSRGLTELIVAAYERYCVSNSWHPDVFPAIREMEAGVVATFLRSVALLISSNGVTLTPTSQKVQQPHQCGNHDFWRYGKDRYGHRGIP